MSIGASLGGGAGAPGRAQPIAPIGRRHVVTNARGGQSWHNFGLGFDVNRSWLLGAQDNFYVGAGFGLKRLYGTGDSEGEFADAPGIVLYSDDWHPGVVGIVAGRLADRYGRPVIVVGFVAAVERRWTWAWTSPPR